MPSYRLSAEVLEDYDDIAIGAPEAFHNPKPSFPRGFSIPDKGSVP